MLDALTSGYALNFSGDTRAFVKDSNEYKLFPYEMLFDITGDKGV